MLICILFVNAFIEMHSWVKVRFCFRTTADSFGKNRKLLAEHLQCIKAIFEEGQHKCRCGQENSITARSVKDIKLIPKKSFNSPFASKKIVPVILEENEINR